MEVKKIVEGMTATQVAQVIDENFNALNGEKATVEAVADVQKNVNRSDDNTGVMSYPEYSSTEPVAVGDVRRYEGLLYRAKEAGAYDWDPEKWERVTLKQLEDEKLSELGQDVNLSNLLFDKAEYNIGYITTGDVGSVVSSLVPNGNTAWKSIIVNANAGERFFIQGKGGGNARLWAFLDTNNVVLSSSKSSYTSRGEYIEAPQNAALVVVNFSNPEITSGVESISFYRVTRLDGDIKTMSLAGGYTQKSLKGYIDTNIEVGEEVQLNITSSNDTFTHYVIDVNDGQEVVINGKGGGVGRLWAFVDSDNKLISKSDSNAELNGESVEVPTNASKVICNIQNSSLYPNVIVRKKNIEARNISKRIEGAEEELKSIKENFGEFDYQIGYITTGDIDTKVLSLSSNGMSTWKSAVVETVEGESFFVQGKGGGEARLWAFLDKDNIVLSSSNKSYNSFGEYIEAPQNAALVVVNFSNVETEKFYRVTRLDKAIENLADNIEDKFDSIFLKKLEPTGDGYILTFTDIGSYVDLIVDSTSSLWKYYVVSVKEGYTLRCEECRGGGNSRLWAFLDKDSNLISISDKSLIVKNYIDIEVPKDAVTLVINSNVGGYPNAKFTLYKKDSIEFRLAELEKKQSSYGEEVTNILIFGNSYSYRSVAQGEGNLANLASSVKANLFIEVIGNAGASFESNYNKHIRGEKNAYRWEGDINFGIKDKASEPLTFVEALKLKEWDYIIFHQASKYSGNIDSFSPYLGDLIDIAKTYCENENVKIGLMQTWAYADIVLEDSAVPMYPTTDTTIPIFTSQEEMYNAICNTYKEAMNRFEDISFVIPAGTAIQNARATELGTKYNDFGSGSNDGSHTNSEGTLITSLVVFNKVFGEKYNIKLSEIQNNYSTLFNDDEFALAIESARMAIKFPFKVMPIV